MRFGREKSCHGRIFMLKYIRIKENYMSHYYTTDNNLTSNIREIEYTYRGNIIKYFVDNGVFSKDRVDFGTNVLLRNLPIFKDNSKVLDVGCGYGAIGLPIAKSNKTLFVEMIDVNLRAIELVKDNLKANKIFNVKVYESNLYENVNSMFDYIISNPPIRAGKKVVFGVVDQGYEHLNDGGEIYVVIQKKQGAPSLLKEMENVFGNAEIIAKESGYFIIKSKKEMK